MVLVNLDRLFSNLNGVTYLFWDIIVHSGFKLD
jgi:hypothetical protein